MWDNTDNTPAGTEKQDNDLLRARHRNNPENEPIGHYTGRCGKCGGNNLWDDNLHYGCNSCGAIYFG